MSTDKLYEPGTVGETEAEHAVSSIAISLKRIADAVCGDEKNSGIVNAIHDIAMQGAPNR